MEKLIFTLRKFVGQRAKCRKYEELELTLFEQSPFLESNLPSANYASPNRKNE